MNQYSRIIKYLFPYKWHVFINIFSNLLGAIFSLFSLAMLIPFLQLLFGNVPLVETKPVLELTTESVTQNLNYILSHLIKTYDKASALLFVIALVLIASFLKNFFTYLALYHLAPIRSGVLRDIRNALYLKIIDLPLGY